MTTNQPTGTKKVAGNLAWKLLERFGVQGIQFVLQIILARILSPSHYGVLSLMVIFTTLANVFIQSGLNTALIQNKDVEEDDFSSVFFVMLAIAVLLYIILFFSAPLIADFYNMPEIIKPFRVLALVLLPGAFNSIQIAKISRELNFKQVFKSNIGSIFVSGAVGVYMAYKGAGIWALVVQYLLNITIAALIMWFSVKWRPKFVCRFNRVKILFKFGWKLLVSNLLETLYQDLRSLVIGKKYSESTLGFYNRGKQFPQFIVNAINGAVQSVMLPVMSEKQDEQNKVKNIARTSIGICSYIMFPMMFGLAGVASPMVSLILTDKWLPCVPYLQIYCFSFSFYPVHSCNLQAINAMGRSDMYLRLELIKKSYGIAALIIAVVFFDSPIAIALTGVFTTFISCFVNASPNKKLIGYSYFEQMRDILPSFLAAAVMFAIVLLVGKLPLSNILLLILQVVTGIAVYLLISATFRFKPFISLLSLVKKLIKK